MNISKHLATNYNYITYIAALFELVGIYCIGDKLVVGFMFNIIGLLLWVLYVILSKSTYGLLLVCIFGVVINLQAFYKWINLI